VIALFGNRGTALTPAQSVAIVCSTTRVWSDNPGTTPWITKSVARAQELGIEKRFGRHTFRHTYSKFLRSVGTEFKVVQELLRHSSLRSTLDVYTQAITPPKHAAQDAVMHLFCLLADTTLPHSSIKELGRHSIIGEDTKGTQIYVLLHPLWFPPIPNKIFRINGGDDGARTRDLCRDRAAL